MQPGEWSYSTFIAWENAKGRCELCGEYIYLTEKGTMRLVGHHVVNRKDGGANTIENCKVRHQECEMIAHKIRKDGNPSIKQFRDYTQRKFAV